MASVLIVDDDVCLALLIAHALAFEGHTASVAHDGQTALQATREHPPDIVVLDVNLPDMKGSDVVAALRRTSDVPIVMLSANADDETIVGALRGGADDYVVKPFSPRQLAARVENVLHRAARRRGAASDAGSPAPPAPPASPSSSARSEADLLRIGPIVLDTNRQELIVSETQRIALTPSEYRLLDLLGRAPGRVFTFEHIIEYVWGGSGGGEATLRAHVSRLRRKLENVPGGDSVLVNRPRVGYSVNP